jgi:formamidopyrimidine-DNA glycosylase
MPELPDIAAYITARGPRVIGEPIKQVRIRSPFLIRTVDSPVSAVEGKRVRELRRLGKRVAFAVEDLLWLVLHLKIAGLFEYWGGPKAEFFACGLRIEFGCAAMGRSLQGRTLGEGESCSQRSS